MTKVSEKVENLKLTKVLKTTFGFDSFRPHQEEICRSVTNGHDTLVVMPTGAGKSLCYQLPGVVRGGTTLVISPLIALIEDQVYKLQKLGLRAHKLHSGCSSEEKSNVYHLHKQRKLDFLFIAPERLEIQGFIELITDFPPSLIAIDEAHCISQWGHDFRPAYRMISERLANIPNIPKVALTATATKSVQEDIVQQLALRNESRFVLGFRRTNIAIQVEKLSKKKRLEKVISLLADSENRPAIIYTSSRKDTEEISEKLSQYFPTLPYHAGFPQEDRDIIQKKFIESEIEIIVATIAFGMGIDKPNIRTVIHMTLPSTIEGYYQEIGRAGRDGKFSKAFLFHNHLDLKIKEFLFEKNFPPYNELQILIESIPRKGLTIQNLASQRGLEESKLFEVLKKIWLLGGVYFNEQNLMFTSNNNWGIGYQNLVNYKKRQFQEVQSFLNTKSCRMLYLVSYFADTKDKGGPCGLCDICRNLSGKKFDSNSPFHNFGIEILKSLSKREIIATGKLFNQLFSTNNLKKQEFNDLLIQMENSYFILLEETSFHKGEHLIKYLTAQISDQGLQYYEKFSTAHDKNTHLATISKGINVKHPSYGNGVIQSVDNEFNMEKVIVLFDNIGPRKVSSSTLIPRDQ